MISNLKSARQSIEAELSHARQGIAFYTARVEALEVALHQLENVEGDDTGKTKSTVKAGAGRMKARRGRKPSAGNAGNGAHRATENGTTRRRRKMVRRGEAGSLPVTGGEFWFGLVSNEPRSAVDISNAAISALGIKPDQKTQIQKLKQRVSPALATLVASQKIKDSGSGRERRFFKA